MKISDYNYDLPESLVATLPPKIRGTSNLLVLDRSNGEILDRKYFEVIDFLEAGDVLVLNDTKVIKARLRAVREDGAKRELVILEKHGYDNNWHHHKVLYRGKLHVNDLLYVDDTELVVDEILGDGLAIVHSEKDLLELADKFGEPPLPPYLHREATEEDVDRYQTVWAKEAGSVAAPTASLNMTDEVLDKLRKKGIKIVYITLHVGLGTFMPIRTDDVEAHHMHQEYFEIPENTVRAIQQAKANKKSVVALGTTVARTLEYAKDELLNGKPAELSGEADIFIYPGYEFKVVDHLITNYHAPKSTVLMLASAFAGKDLLFKAYRHAVEQKYKFLSYGDSMLIL